jgi:hypothetical protein
MMASTGANVLGVLKNKDGPAASACHQREPAVDDISVLSSGKRIVESMSSTYPSQAYRLCSDVQGS